MKIALISDLHIDVSNINVTDLGIDAKKIDIIIVAGDIASSFVLRNYFLTGLKKKDRPILFVPGNHDYWGSTPVTEPFTCGYRDDDIKIIGATLWTKLDSVQWVHYIHGLNDYRYMYGQTKEKYNETHEREKKILFDSGADIIISHHCPTFKSIHPKYAGSPVNCCFANDLEAEILALPKPPKIWIHGHTHEAMDYWIGNTHIICHPRGYPGESNHKGYKARIIDYDGYSKTKTK